MMSKYEVSDLVPHSGTMSLLDRIISYGDDWLEAEVMITNESLFVCGEGVPASIGLEYMAQAIAAYSGLEEQAKTGIPKLGFLLGTRKYKCSTDYFKIGDVITLNVKREMQAENGLHVFQCILSGNEIEATARLNVFQPEDSNKFLKSIKV